VNLVEPPGTDAHASTSLCIASSARRPFTPVRVAQPFVAIVALTSCAFGGWGGGGEGGAVAHAAPSAANVARDRRSIPLDITPAHLAEHIRAPVRPTRGRAETWPLRSPRSMYNLATRARSCAPWHPLPVEAMGDRVVEPSASNRSSAHSARVQDRHVARVEASIVDERQ
jgi:hypothetical protein